MDGAKLKVTAGRAAGTEIPLEGDFLIGRGSEDEHGRLADDIEISRQHARVSQTASGDLQIEDLGSTNGTFVNGKRISAPQVLKPGDEIKVGETTMTLDAPGAAQPTAIGAVPPPPPQATAAGATAPKPKPPAKKSGGDRTPLIAAIAGGVVLLAAIVVGVILLTGGGGSDKPKKLTEQQVVSQSRPTVIKLVGRVANSTQGGTGVIIDAKRGLAITNAHVVQGTSALKATVLDKTEVPARIVAVSPCDDLAVIQLAEKPAGIRAMKLGSSKTVHSGQKVTVLGYPVSLQQTPDVSASKLVATSGTVSNPDVSATIGSSGPKYPSLIQHQAPVNHGNSGGPLVNQYGQLIGINTLANTGQAGEVQGQYYSISIDHAKDLLPDLKKGKSIANLGWNLIPTTRPVLTQLFGAHDAGVVRFVLTKLIHDPNGLLVLGVDPGSSAADGNFQTGDYVTEINNSKVSSVQDVCDIVKSATPGSKIKVGGYYVLTGPSSKFGDGYTENLTVK